MDLDRKRWQVVAAGILFNLCAGATYVFSVFETSLRQHLGCSKAEFALAFSLNVAFVPVGMLVSGAIADRKGPRPVVAAGGLLYGLGLLLAGYSNSLAWLYVTYGLMMSLGNGAAYGALVGAAVKWFPDKRGTVSGIVVSALGTGTLVIAPIAQWMIDLPGLGVMGAFKVMGGVFIAAGLLASCFVSKPPAGYRPRSMQNDDAANAGADNDTHWPQMLRRCRFWMLYVMYMCGAFAGLMVVSQASAIAQEVTSLAPAAAALVVSVIGLANLAGRMFWGALSDRVGRFETLSLMFVITAGVMFGLSTLASAAPTLVLAYALVALCYGGYLGVFPSICADTFGSRNLTLNYALMFSAFSFAGILGPRVGAILRESTGRYTEAFVTAGAMACIGLALALIARLADSRAVSTKPPAV